MPNFRRCLTDKYLVASGGSALVVLKTQTGEIIWKRDRANYRATCSEEVVFYSGQPRDSISTFDLTTRQHLWGGTKPLKSFGALIYNSEAQEIIASETTLPGDLYVVDPKTGQLLRSFKEVGFAPMNNSWVQGPQYLIDRGQLFIGGTVLDARTGQVMHEEDYYFTAVSPTVTTDTIYISSLAVVALERTTFEVKWRYQPPSKLEGAFLSRGLPEVVREIFPLSHVVILDGVGYVIFTDLTIRAIDLNTGQELGYWQPGWPQLWRSPLCDAPLPVPGCSSSARADLTTLNDMLFVSFGDGKLYAFGRE